MSKFPQHLIDMAKRQPPKDCDVIPGSTPVISFGDFQRSKVATLGINPSNQEFLDGGELLTDKKQRLCSTPSFNLQAMDELTDEHAVKIIDACNSYFQNNPYKWFNDLEKVLTRGLNASYEDESACHLDLSQWATSSKWRSLSEIQQNTLLDEGVPYLTQQLNSSNISHVIVNGKSVWDEIKKSKLATFEDVGKMTFGKNKTSVTLRKGANGSSIFLGWTVNIQSGHGSNADEFLQRLGDWLQENQ